MKIVKFTPNSDKLLRGIFLECPLCGKEMTVYDFCGTYFKTTCMDHYWINEFNIREE